MYHFTAVAQTDFHFSFALIFNNYFLYKSLLLLFCGPSLIGMKKSTTSVGGILYATAMGNRMQCNAVVDNERLDSLLVESADKTASKMV